MKNLMSIALGFTLACGAWNAVASDDKKPAKKDTHEKKDPAHKDEKKPKKDH